MENTLAPNEIEVKKTSKPLLRTLLYILIPLLLLVSLFFIFKSDINDFILDTKDSICKEDTKIDEDEETEDATEETNIQEDEKVVIKEGELYTIKTTLPEGWNLKLNYDGKDSKSLVTDGTSYNGLTGIEVNKGINEVFSMNAAYGIGMSSCETYYTFSDSPSLDLVAIEDEIGYEPTVVDLSETTFTEITILENSFRRIGSTYYENISTNPNKFEVSCYLGLTNFKNLYAKTSDNENVNTYFFKVTPGLSESDLKILDSILNNIELAYYE